MLPAILGLSGPTLTPDERAFIREAAPAGFILFRRNCRDREQLQALTDDLREVTGRDRLPILIDQEGGPIVRLGPRQWPSFPAAARFGKVYERAPISGMEAARLNGLAIGLTLAEVGINVTTAPLLDLRHDGAHPVIGERAFGSDPLQVAALGRAMLDGLADGGVAGCIKHVPGHGRARVDSHAELPVVDAPADELERDLLPFARLSRAPFAMAAHILYTAWDPEHPATHSPTIIRDIVRGRAAFAGLILSDSLKMKALPGKLEERGLAALAAGCDSVLHCTGDFADNLRLAEALPASPEPLSGRLDKALASSAVLPGFGKLADTLARRDALLALA